MKEGKRDQKLIGLNIIICINVIALLYGLYDELSTQKIDSDRGVFYFLYFASAVLIWGLYVRSNIARVLTLIFLWLSLVLAALGILLIAFSSEIFVYHWTGYVIGVLGITWDIWQILYFNKPEVMKAFSVVVVEKGYSGDEKCPYCDGRLRSANAKQCPHCLMAWHDSSNPRKLNA